jgi:hypothetical protein
MVAAVPLLVAAGWLVVKGIPGAPVACGKLFSLEEVERVTGRKSGPPSYHAGEATCGMSYVGMDVVLMRTGRAERHVFDITLDRYKRDKRSPDVQPLREVPGEAVVVDFHWQTKGRDAVEKRILVKRPGGALELRLVGREAEVTLWQQGVVPLIAGKLASADAYLDGK